METSEADIVREKDSPSKNLVTFIVSSKQVNLEV